MSYLASCAGGGLISVVVLAMISDNAFIVTLEPEQMALCTNNIASTYMYSPRS